MELIKNIFFNTDKLIENNVVKISYTGRFFQENSEKVFIHYGFGDSWDCMKDIEMKKTELGFQTELKLSSSQPLNICFRNSNNSWDNNDFKNYSFSIEPFSVALAVVDNHEMIYPKKLRKSYLLSKKIKLAIYKIIKYLPKLVSGNYTKKTTSEN